MGALLLRLTTPAEGYDRSRPGPSQSGPDWRQSCSALAGEDFSAIPDALLVCREQIVDQSEDARGESER